MTSHTSKPRLQVGLKVIRAWFILGELGIRDSDVALPASGAPGIGFRYDVTGASHVTVVEFYASTDAHPTVTSVSHQYHVIGWTTGVEGFSFAIGLVRRAICRDKNDFWEINNNIFGVNETFVKYLQRNYYHNFNHYQTIMHPTLHGNKNSPKISAHPKPGFELQT